MYYPDLTTYEYIKERIDPQALNVGWLDEKHGFATFEPSVVFLNRLFMYCLNPVNPTRGYHICPFCHDSQFGLDALRSGRRIRLGSAEIRVEGKDGRIYAAPNLIYHYVADHKYHPPDEFIKAVLNQTMHNGD